MQYWLWKKHFIDLKDWIIGLIFRLHFIRAIESIFDLALQNLITYYQVIPTSIVQRSGLESWVVISAEVSSSWKRLYCKALLEFIFIQINVWLSFTLRRKHYRPLSIFVFRVYSEEEIIILQADSRVLAEWSWEFIMRLRILTVTFL